MENIVGRIRYLCSVKGITVAELERRMNFGNGTVRRIKICTRCYRSDWITKLQNILE